MRIFGVFIYVSTKVDANNKEKKVKKLVFYIEDDAKIKKRIQKFISLK